MDFFEFLWLFGMIIVLPIVLVKLSMDHKLEKLREQVNLNEALDYQSSREEGISVAELKTLFREVIEETHAPLDDRLHELEQLQSGDSVEIESGAEEEIDSTRSGKR